MGRIQRDEVIQPDLLGPAIKEAKDLLIQFDATRAGLELFAKTTRELAKDLGITSKDVVKLQKANSQLTETQKEVVAIDRQREKLSAKITQAQTKQAKSNAVLRKNLQDLNKENKKLIEVNEELGKEYDSLEDAISDLDNAEVKNINTKSEAIKQNKALRAIVNDLNPSIEEQADQITRLNGVIDKNTEFLKDNSDENTKAKISIGGYAEGIREALGDSVKLGDQFGALGGVVEFLSSRLTRNNKDLDDTSENLDNAGNQANKTGRRFRNLGRVLKGIGIGAVLAVVGSVGAAFSTSQEDALKLQIQLGRLGNQFSTLFARIGNAGSGIILLFESIGDSFKGIPDQLGGAFEISQKRAEIALLQLQKTIDSTLGRSTDEASKKISTLFTEIGELGDKLTDTSKQDEGIKRITTAFDGFGKSLAETDKITEEIIKKRFELAFATRTLELEVARLAKTEEVLAVQAEDDARSLLEQRKANEDLTVATRLRISAQIKLAKEQLRISNEQIRLELKRKDAIDLTDDQISKINENEKLRGKVSVEALDAQSQANIKLLDAQKELAVFAEQRGSRQGLIDLDLFEQNLDFLIDITERNRNLLTQQAEDVDRSVASRIDSFSQLDDALREDLQNQADEFTKLQTALGKPVDFEINLDDNGDIKLLIDGTEQSTTNVKELNKNLQLLNVPEKAINRLREVIQDGKDASKEISVLGKEFVKLEDAINPEERGELIISESELERIKQLNDELEFLGAQDVSNLSSEQLDDLAKKLDDVNKEITDSEKQAQQERINNRIKAIDAELLVVEDGSITQIQLEKEKNELLLDLEKQRVEGTKAQLKKEQDARNEASKELGKSIREGAEFADTIADSFFEKELKRIDDKIKASQDEQDRLEEISKTATGDAARQAEQTLAFEKQNEAERLVEKEKALKRQQQVEFLLAGIKAFGAKVESGDQTPVKSVLQDVGVLIAGIKALPGFKKGTDRVGKDISKTFNTGTDDYVARLHEGEKVFTAEDSAKIGYNISNAEAADIVYSRLHGNLLTKEEAQTIQAPSYSYSSSDPRLLSEQMKTNELLNSLPAKMPKSGLEFDEMTKIFRQILKQGNKTTKNEGRINGLFR